MGSLHVISIKHFHSILLNAQKSCPMFKIVLLSIKFEVSPIFVLYFLVKHFNQNNCEHTNILKTLVS